MSLSTRGFSTARKPGVHYVSPFFDPVGYELGQMARQPAPAAKPVKLTEADWRRKPGREGLRKTGAPSSAELLNRTNVPEEVRILCDEYKMRLGCGRALYQLWRARGALISFENFVVFGDNARRSVVSEIRRNTGLGDDLVNEIGLGYRLGPLALAKIDRLMAARKTP